VQHFALISAGYFSEGLYARQLREWLRHFPKERFLYLLTEDLRDRPKELLRTATEFLGIDLRVRVETASQYNVASQPRWPWLMRFLAGRSVIKRPIGALLPTYLKRQIRVRIRRLNVKSMNSRPQLDPSLAASLRRAYREDVRQLSDLIDRDLSHWLTP
jgi:hypothetical protein